MSAKISSLGERRKKNWFLEKKIFLCEAVICKEKNQYSINFAEKMGLFRKLNDV
jgi:hypothetical protein